MEIDCHFGRLGDAETADAIAFNCSPLANGNLNTYFLGVRFLARRKTGLQL